MQVALRLASGVVIDDRLTQKSTKDAVGSAWQEYERDHKGERPRGALPHKTDRLACAQLASPEAAQEVEAGAARNKENGSKGPKRADDQPLEVVGSR